MMSDERQRRRPTINASAGSDLVGVGGHPRHGAHVDPDRRQGPPRAQSDDQPLVAGPALRVGARTDDLADARRGAGLEIEFDFVDHVLDLRTTDGGVDTRARARSVANFYAATMAALDELGVHVAIFPVRPRWSTPSRSTRTSCTARTTPTRHTVSGSRSSRLSGCMLEFRAGFIGKASPVHFFWGGADLATTRFSGRPAPEASRWRTELPRLGSGAGLQPRS